MISYSNVSETPLCSIILSDSCPLHCILIGVRHQPLYCIHHDIALYNGSESPFECIQVGVSRHYVVFLSE